MLLYMWLGTVGPMRTRLEVLFSMINLAIHSGPPPGLVLVEPQPL